MITGTLHRYYQKVWLPAFLTDLKRDGMEDVDCKEIESQFAGQFEVGKQIDQHMDAKTARELKELGIIMTAFRIVKRNNNSLAIGDQGFVETEKIDFSP